ncbi:MAG: type II secretion system F family protein [bacterium]|nr:type II secretion system F family protein [bacterium]
MAIKKNKQDTLVEKNLFQNEVTIGKINIEQKMLFAKYCAIMLASGIPIVETIRITVDQSSGKMRRVLIKVLKTIETGQKLSDALAKFPKVFSELYVNMVKIGEESGTLEQNFTYIASQLKKDKELRDKIKGALIYPITVLGAAGILGFSFALFVLPQLSGFFSGLRIELPLSTRILLWLSNFFDQYGIEVFLVVVVGGSFLAWVIRQKFSQPVVHWIVLRIPIVKGVVKYTNLIQFCRTLSLLLKSGLTIDNALKITHNTVSNYYFKQAITDITKHVKRGASVSEHIAFHEDIFPKIVSRLVSVGEKSGRIEENLNYLADFFDDELDNTTKSLSTALEPVMLIFIGLVVAALAISIITPIYEITGNITQQ